MLIAHRLQLDNIRQIEALYQDFSACAQESYRWDMAPIDFNILTSAIGQGLMSGLFVQDPAENKTVAFMLYRLEEHKAIEINVIYIPDRERQKNILDCLMRKFLEVAEKTPGWDVVSFAMLGQQEDLIQTLTWYGFKPMGQAILKFDVIDPLTIQILMQQKLEPLPDHYQIDCWKPEYAGGTAETLFEAFSKAADALWDPRFRSIYGTKGIVSTLCADHMGRHIPECTSVLLKEGVPVGVCFFLEAKLGSGNIPLVGVRPSEKGNRFGNTLLKTTLDKAIQAMLDEKIGILEITATMETDNFSAIKMYRRMGFREIYNYPHVYLSKDMLENLKKGRWCLEGGGMN